MPKPKIDTAILSLLQNIAASGLHQVASQQIAAQLGLSGATVNRHLAKLLANKQVQRSGKGPSTRYCLPDPAQAKLDENLTGSAPNWSEQALILKNHLSTPLGMRNPVTYQRHWVDDYTPNASHLLPIALADALYKEGRMQGNLPASTYARKVLEQLLIDLSWTSSRLEGNRYTLLGTQELFERGRKVDPADLDAIMLLNHKDAIEFLVDALPAYGLNSMVVRNVHALLMNDLLVNSQGLGTIRQKVVNISDTVYLPAQNPHLLSEMLEQMIAKACMVKNPIEAAFFLWVNLAYLQPFEDGNKRVSRVCANIPLMLYNCAPLSFLDVDVEIYAQAMMGVYELQNIAMAADLFVWTYRRSIRKYSVVLESMAAPDPFRARYRLQIGDAVRQVVEGGQTVDAAVAALAIDDADRRDFAAVLRDDLAHLEPFNCARFRLSMEKTERWILAGRLV